MERIKETVQVDIRVGRRKEEREVIGDSALGSESREAGKEREPIERENRVTGGHPQRWPWVSQVSLAHKTQTTEPKRSV